MKKNNLDERQEQILLKIEHNGCYIAFWGLLIVFLAEAFIFDFNLKAIAGEWIVLMVLCFYLLIACTKNGIWDRRLKPNFKTNAIISAIAAVIFGVLIAVSVGLRDPEAITVSIICGVLSAAIVFGCCIIALTLTAKRVRKKAAEQETEEVE